MRIQNVRIIPLKNDYIETLEGQRTLTQIVDKRQECDEIATYSEEDYTISNIMVEASYSTLFTGDNSETKQLVADLFLGNDEFQYTYTWWEMDMNMKQPTREQIAEHIVKTWYFPVDPEDKEEIEEITQSEEYAFHDTIYFKCLSPERTKEIAAKLNKDIILSTAKEMEETLNKDGIFFDDMQEDSDMKLIDELMNMVKKAADENIGILYIMEVW